MARLGKGLVRGDDGIVRCWWCASAPDYAAYHDEEWGWPVRDDVRLFAALSKELKQRGWAFVGPTTVYAFMQAMGLVNDHLEGCVVRNRIAEEDRA
jgi:3-methyladenine DNA glycosylase Tag